MPAERAKPLLTWSLVCMFESHEEALVAPADREAPVDAPAKIADGAIRKQSVDDQLGAAEKQNTDASYDGVDLDDHEKREHYRCEDDEESERLVEVLL